MRQFTLIILIILTGYSPMKANQIIYPWRACPAIVLAAENLEILYDNIFELEIDSVILEGPFNRVMLPLSKIDIGRFEYDTFSKAATNNKIVVMVPENTPEELYSLIIKSGGETNISKKSVKVLKEYRNPHSFIHLSDLHVSRQWIGTAENGYAKELELLDKFIEVANIISPDYIIVTGDLIHDYTRFNADSTGWRGTVLSGPEQRPLAEEKFKNYFEGAFGFSGVYGFNAPVFSLPGNHDFYGLEKDDYRGKVAQWNKLMGKRVYGFNYLDTRIIASDDFLGDPITDIPENAPMSGLQGVELEQFLTSAGHGKLRIMAQHRHNRVDTSFINKHNINILLNGHSHTPKVNHVGTTPTVSIRSGVVCRSGNIKIWEKTLGLFRVFRIDGDDFQYSPPLRFCENPTAPYNNLIMNLTLDYKRENSGRHISNEALITNKLDVDLPGCRVRFVMPKGKYKVSKGIIHQVIETPEFSVFDINVDVDAFSTTLVKITKANSI